MKNYHIFTRTWWKNNPKYPNGLEPEACKKTTIKHVDTIERARSFCLEYNATHDGGSNGRKAEFEEV